MVYEESIDKNSVIPIYYQLAKLLEGQIRKGKLTPGEALPTEMEISARFEISRMTVRRAILELVTAGMVFTQQGKGTFVARPKLDNILFELNSFETDVKRNGLSTTTKLIDAQIIRADDRLKEKFEIVGDNIRFLYLRTVMSAENEPLTYEKKYLFYSKRKPTLESELKDPSLPGLIAAHSGQLPVSSKKVLQVAAASEEQASILAIAPNTPVFAIEQTFYDSDQKPLGWSMSIYRGDRYKLTGYDGWYRKD